MFYLITHPNVVISRDVPVPRWPLSELGKQRMRAGLRQPWVRDITAIYCSTEQKAIDGAAILAEHLSLPFHEVEALGENDRSATGFLPPDEFERVADRVLRLAGQIHSRLGASRGCAEPHRARGGDRLRRDKRRPSPSSRTAPWARCFTAILPARPIARRWDQPPNGGGNFYGFTLSPRAVHSWWRAIDT